MCACPRWGVRRCQVLRKLRIDPPANELSKAATKEVELGRLRGPMPVDAVDLADAAIATRFGVDRGALLARCAIMHAP